PDLLCNENVRPRRRLQAHPALLWQSAIRNILQQRAVSQPDAGRPFSFCATKARQKMVSRQTTREPRNVLIASFQSAIFFGEAPCFRHGASILSATLKFVLSTCGDWDTCDS